MFSHAWLGSKSPGSVAIVRFCCGCSTKDGVNQHQRPFRLRLKLLSAKRPMGDHKGCSVVDLSPWSTKHRRAESLPSCGNDRLALDCSPLLSRGVDLSPDRGRRATRYPNEGKADRWGQVASNHRSRSQCYGAMALCRCSSPIPHCPRRGDCHQGTHSTISRWSPQDS